ncbi:MAG: hypothetical protein QG657_4173, partial [Acidobacteriota bacterium]|nr:hypothetical protein [Acidobacteriota bacterium]
MNKWYLLFIMLIVCFIAGPSADFRVQKENPMPLDANNELKPGNIKIDRDYGIMPLTFIPNQGQMDQQVYYYVQGKDKTVYFTSEGVTYSLNASGGSEPFFKRVPTPPKTFTNEQKSKDLSKRWVVKLEFVGAKKNVKPECLEQSGTKVSYFKGKPELWHTGLRAASKIIYHELWRGIDLVYYGTVNKMKYEFIVHPGADPSQIKLAYRGAESVKENRQGQLEVKTPAGGFFDDTPVAWQEIAGKRESVTLKYSVEKGKSGKETGDAPVVTYGFSVGIYDTKQTLILDPAIIIYCGYIGGSGDDWAQDIAIDAAGCAYVTGYTRSTEATFPAKVGPDLTISLYDDAFVAKVNADGTAIDYCGYIGGNGGDKGIGIAVDSLGCAYVAGIAGSSETTFPVVVGPDLTDNDICCYEVFVAKVNAAGTDLVYCGYIGGSAEDVARGIAVDGSGCAYVVGITDSSETDFPVAVGPDLTYNTNSDAFVAKVKADGTGLIYCGYIGGSGDDRGNGIAIDSTGCVYVTGYTTSTETDFPATVGPDLTFNGMADAFVAKIKADGTGLIYSGYIGGFYNDEGADIAVDTLGCAYITGGTECSQPDFPVTVGPDLIHNGDWDAIVVKVNATGTGLVYCGYIGGSAGEDARAIALDTSGCAYITGYTNSDQTTFPVTVGPDLTHNGNWDAFVVKVNATGAGLVYCGYIGGSGWDTCHGIAADITGSVYVTGYTSSTETTFPVTVGPDLIHNGSFDSFVAKISGNPIYTVNFAAGNGGTLTGVTSQTVVQGNNCSAVTAVPNSGYNFANWTGTNGFITTTNNPLTVANVNSDMMITANFAHSNPAGWIPLEDFQNNMIVYGKAYTGNNPTAEGDWIGAFGPEGTSDCRGIAAVQANGNYYLTIGSNENSAETITFQLWPLPSGPAIDGSESISFINDGVYSGLPLHFGPRGQNLALVNGWNWISFNTLPTDTSFNSVFGTPGVIEQIKSQTQAAIYTSGSWIGDLTDMSGIANGILYKVKTNQAYAFNVTGMTVPYNTPLSLITGWNWTAYLPTLSQPVADAVNSIITPVSQVKSQTNSVIKIGSALFGDLTQMEPNKGYTILMNQP